MILIFYFVTLIFYFAMLIFYFVAIPIKMGAAKYGPIYGIGPEYSPIFTLLSQNVPFCCDSHKIFCHLNARFRSILILSFRSCPRDALTLIKYFACKNGWEMGIAVALKFLEIPDFTGFFGLS